MRCSPHWRRLGVARRCNPFPGSPWARWVNSRRTAMTFHAEAFLLDENPGFTTLEPASAPSRLGECWVRFAPHHGEGERDVRVRYALYGATAAPVVIVQGGISADCHAAPQDGYAGWGKQLAGADA